MAKSATTEEPETQAPADATEASQVELPEAADGGGAGSGQIDLLLDMDMTVDAILGSCRLEVRRLLQLAPGSVVKLDKGVGDGVELTLRGVKFATGQLVVVGDQLGVRIGQIVPPAEGGED